LFANRLHQFFKFESHRFVGVRANVLVELLIHLLDHAVYPAEYLVIDQVHLLMDGFYLTGLTLHHCDLAVKCDKLWVRSTKFVFAGANVTSFLGLKHLQLTQLLTPLFVVCPQHIDFLFIHRDRVEQLAVGRLSGEKLLHDLLDIIAAGGGTNFLEGVFDFKIAFHHLLHFSLQESRPKLLSQEVLLHLQLI